MLNRMREYPPFPIKFKNEQAAKLLIIIPRITTKPLGNLIHLLRRPDAAIKHTHPLPLRLRLPTRLPAHDEPLVAVVGVGSSASGFDDAFGEDC